METAISRLATRSCSRTSVTWRAAYRDERGWHGGGAVLDASPTGIFLRARGGRVHVGDSLHLRCQPPTRRRAQSPRAFDVWGTVRWVGFSRRHGCEGAGIQLTGENSRLRSHLLSAVEAVTARLSTEELSPRYGVLTVTADPDLARAVRDAARESAELAAQCESLGERAVERVLASPPDFLIVDSALPDMDGRDLLRRLQLSGLSERTLILVASTRDSQPDRRLALELGACHYEIKPLHATRLRNRIEYLLEKRDARAAGSGPRLSTSTR